MNVNNRIGPANNYSIIPSLSHSIIRLFDYSIIRKARQGFTLIELLIVITMIAILMAAMTTSVAKARTRAKISQATQETKEMTNAILAYEQYAKDHTLSKYAGSGWVRCTEGAVRMILGGGESGETGEQIPVLYNGRVRGGQLLDPWGTAYEYRIEPTASWPGMDAPDLKSSAALPNYFRLTDGERGADALEEEGK